MVIPSEAWRRQHKFTWIAVIKILPLSYHHSHFWATTLDFTNPVASLAWLNHYSQQNCSYVTCYNQLHCYKLCPLNAETEANTAIWCVLQLWEESTSDTDFSLDFLADWCCIIAQTCDTCCTSSSFSMDGHVAASLISWQSESSLQFDACPSQSRSHVIDHVIFTKIKGVRQHQVHLWFLPPACTQIPKTGYIGTSIKHGALLETTKPDADT